MLIALQSLYKQLADAKTLRLRMPAAKDAHGQGAVPAADVVVSFAERLMLPTGRLTGWVRVARADGGGDQNHRGAHTCLR